MTPVWRKSSRSGTSTHSDCVEVAHLWCKSSHSGSDPAKQDCVEVAQLWRKASHSGSSSGQSDCVEVAQLTAKVGVRDSKAPEAPHLVFDVADWRRFADRVKRGEHDLA
ncbi:MULTISPECIES: DUF397 domain-containing protein [Actinomadura]|uniref:DUF397 domain-containing protein n=1 Tax=Actinomadura geliboluensis TaxID=882440 RepID=A0A5S4GHT4_9ACTN|nr:DUF397 domain-containing protein [Actinomadura geliboluensis]TMR25810.1 DUF397 domain-containing protein [Actinomadura geliboluensis]